MKGKTRKTFINNFSFLVLRNPRSTKNAIPIVITSSSILLTISTNFPLPQPSRNSLEFETCEFRKVGKPGEERLKLRFSRGIPRRFRPSLRILTTPRDRSNASSNVTQSRTPWKRTNQLWTGRIFRIPRDPRFVTRYRRPFPTDNPNRVIIQMLIISPEVVHIPTTVTDFFLPDLYYIRSNTRYETGLWTIG